MSKSIKFPPEHYIGFVARDQFEGDDRNFLPLAFMTPNDTDKAAEKRRASVDTWVANNSRGYDHTTRTSFTKQQPKPVVLKNEPLAGFRLLDDVKRNSGWGTGNVKWRIEDPRGFELEITSPNLMKILRCTVIDQGEILDRCMWAREGAENVLVPVSSEVYQQAVENTERGKKKASLRDLKIGDTVILQNGTKGRYFGKMNAVERVSRHTTDPVIFKYTPRYLIVVADEKEILAIASLKLAEIIEGDELTKVEAEQIIRTKFSAKDWSYTGYGYGFTFSNTLPTVVREIEEVDEDEKLRGVFEVDNVLYTREYGWDRGDVIEAVQISRQLWEDCYVISKLESNHSYYGGLNRRNDPYHATFSLLDLRSKGIKSHRPISRVTLEDGFSFTIKH